MLNNKATRIDTTLSNDELLRLQEQELAKPADEVDWEMVEAYSDEIIRRKGLQMDWTSCISKAYRAILDELGEPKPKTEEALVPHKCTPVCAETIHYHRRRPFFSTKYVLAAVLLICLFVVGVYADINGRVIKNTNYVTYEFTQESLEEAPVLSAHLQTDSPLYQALEAAGISQVLLPSTTALSGYTGTVQDDDESLPNGVKSILWKNEQHSIEFTVDSRHLQGESTYKYSFHYQRLEDFVGENGIHYYMGVSEEKTYILFCANHALYTITTDLGWEDAKALALSVH